MELSKTGTGGYAQMVHEPYRRSWTVESLAGFVLGGCQKEAKEVIIYSGFIIIIIASLNTNYYSRVGPLVTLTPT